MRRQLTRWLIVLLLALFAGCLYGYRLADAPPHLEIDEILIALDGHATASTGRDIRGELLPLYFQTADHSWYQPAVIYLTALVLRVAPLTEWSIRLPTVGIAIASILLMYFVARRLFGGALFGLVASGMLALTPAHFIHSRYAMDYVYPVPFILAWLLCMVAWTEGIDAPPDGARAARRPDALLVAGGVCLGVGFYSYIASIVMMPVYFGLTCMLLALHKSPRRAYGLAAVGFVPFLLPFLVWLARHPAAYGATVAKYGLYDANTLDAVQGLRSIAGYMSVSQRLSQYWSFFNPSFLFFGSGTKLMFSTNQVGVFLFAEGILLIIGLYYAVSRRRPIMLAIVLGLVTAPLASLIVTEENAIFRALGIVPFGVLLATAGVHDLWSSSTAKPFRPISIAASLAVVVVGGAYVAFTLLTQRRVTASSLPLIALAAALLWLARVPDRVKQWRIVAVCLLALMPIQFAGFWNDYFSDYRVRSSFWLGGNIRGALETIIDRDARRQVPAVYFSTLKATSGQIDTRDQYMQMYWRFYLLKHGRDDLRARSRPFEPAAVRAMERGSLVLANLGDTTIEPLVRAGDLQQVAVIPELSDHPFFIVLER